MTRPSCTKTDSPHLEIPHRQTAPTWKFHTERQPPPGDSTQTDSPHLEIPHRQPAPNWRFHAEYQLLQPQTCPDDIICTRLLINEGIDEKIFEEKLLK
jgi:hypothetical protein